MGFIKNRRGSCAILTGAFAVPAAMSLAQQGVVSATPGGYVDQTAAQSLLGKVWQSEWGKAGVLTVGVLVLIAAFVLFEKSKGENKVEVLNKNSGGVRGKAVKKKSDSEDNNIIPYKKDSELKNFEKSKKENKVEGLDKNSGNVEVEAVEKKSNSENNNIIHDKKDSESYDLQINTTKEELISKADSSGITPEEREFSNFIKTTKSSKVRFLVKKLSPGCGENGGWGWNYCLFAFNLEKSKEFLGESERLFKIRRNNKDRAFVEMFDVDGSKFHSEVVGWKLCGYVDVENKVHVFYKDDSEALERGIILDKIRKATNYNCENIQDLHSD